VALWITLGIIAVVVIGLIFVVIGMYNGLVRARLRVREAWSGIAVQLKRRTDLVPNLVETVKGYASHEREVFENVTRARSMLQQAGTPAQAAEANNMLTQTLRSLFAVAEAYPDLKANQNFLDLQNELSDIEEKIAYARQFYNTNALSYNEKVHTFPSVIFANMFNFEPAEFFEVEEAERQVPRVSFDTPAAPPAAPPPAAGS
jgi:LemA protein